MPLDSSTQKYKGKSTVSETPSYELSSIFLLLFSLRSKHSSQQFVFRYSSLRLSFHFP